MVFRERDDEPDFGREVRCRRIQETYDSCRGRVWLEDLIVHGVNDESWVRLDPLCEDGSEEPLFCLEGTEGEVPVDFGVFFCLIPIPVTVDRWLQTRSMGYRVCRSGIHAKSSKPIGISSIVSVNLDLWDAR